MIVGLLIWCLVVLQWLLLDLMLLCLFWLVVCCLIVLGNLQLCCFGACCWLLWVWWGGFGFNFDWCLFTVFWVNIVCLVCRFD